MSANKLGPTTGMIASVTTHDEHLDNGRPRWSAAEAAKRCGVGRATIQRHLAAGKIPGATKVDKTWSIPLDGLLAAGFTPDRPALPDADRDQARASDEQAIEHVRAADQLAQRVRELEQSLAASQADVEQERLRRLNAEAIADERANHVADLRKTLAMLTSGSSDVKAPASDTPTLSPAQTPQQRGFFGRLLAPLL